MKLNPPELTLERFHYDPKTGVLSAEDSQLRNQSFDGHYRWLGRLYDDACDEGIAIRSTKTGKVVRFYLHSTERNRDNDITCWNFFPEDATKTGIRSVVIFND